MKCETNKTQKRERLDAPVSNLPALTGYLKLILTSL